MSDSRRPRRVIYLSYDGLAEPLGRSQVLPYVEALAALGHEMELVTFEKPGSPLAFRETLAPRVRWTALRYHRTPTVPATAFDMTQGALLVALGGLALRADLVHVRSYVPGLTALPWSRLSGTPLLFDTRGLWPDEKVESGSWSRESRIYASAKRVERELFRRADAITVLTRSFHRYLRDEYPFRGEIRAPIHVIPTCVDLDRFHPDAPADPDLERDLGGSRVLAYGGSLGGFYLAEEMARFYLAWRTFEKPARFLVLSTQDPASIRRVLAASGCEHELVHRAASREQMPRFLRCAHAVVGIDRRGFGGRGAAPTKLGEALACGLPVAMTESGDVRSVLSDSAVGTLIETTDGPALERHARRLSELANHPETSRRAVAVARRWFSLEAGAHAYDRLYAALPRRRSEQLAPIGDADWPPEPERT